MQKPRLNLNKGLPLGAQPFKLPTWTWTSTLSTWARACGVDGCLGGGAVNPRQLSDDYLSDSEDEEDDAAAAAKSCS